MLLQFNYVTMKNFFGFGEIEARFELNRDGTTSITGANGVGKTTILNAISVCLYDKALKKDIKKDSMINYINNKRMLVTCGFTKGEHTYVIERARKMVTGSEGNYVNVFRDGVDITQAGSVNATDLIASILNIPYDLFVRIVTISAIGVPFLDLPVKAQNAACQTDIIEELFDLKILSQKASILKDAIKDTKASLEAQFIRKEALEDERERYTEQLERTQSRLTRWVDQREEELTATSAALAKATAIDVDAEEAILKDIEALEMSMQDLTPLKRELKSLLLDATKKKTDAAHELSHLSDGTCPYCKQAMDDVKSKIATATKTITFCDESIVDFTAQVDDINIKIQDIDDELAKLEDSASVDSLKDLYATQNTIKNLSIKLEELQTQENPHQETLDDMLNVDLGTFDMETINGLDKYLQHQNMVLKLLTKKDSFIRKNLINQNIPYLNSRINHYMHALDMTQIIEFKFDMTASVTKLGRTLDFACLSHGQKSRINLAMSFAFRDVLQNLHGQINICMLDEVLDTGLDEEGSNAAVNMLKLKGAEEGVSIFVITHKTELLHAFPNMVKISMVDDFSIIEEVPT